MRCLINSLEIRIMSSQGSSQSTNNMKNHMGCANSHPIQTMQCPSLMCLWFREKLLTMKQSYSECLTSKTLIGLGQANTAHTSAVFKRYTVNMSLYNTAVFYLPPMWYVELLQWFPRLTVLLYMLHATYPCWHWVDWPLRVTFLKITV